MATRRVASDKHAMVKDYRLDTAKVHDINHFEDLTKDETDGGKVYADSAYRDTMRRKKLEARGVFYGVMHKRVRGQSELTAEQKYHNRLCARVRGLCEMPFAWLLKAERKRTRYRGGGEEDRNGLRLVGDGLQPLAEPEHPAGLKHER